jgi:hypothetical protein
MYASTLCPEQDHETAEKRLWKAVIARTVEEWIGGPLRHQQAAELYLFDDRNDFPMVCESAGVDPNRLRNRLLSLKRKGASVAAVSARNDEAA